MIAHNSGGPRDDICLPPVSDRSRVSTRVLFTFCMWLQAAAAKFYKGCSESIKPYWLCDGVEDFADAIIR